MEININKPVDHKWTSEDVVGDYRKYQDKEIENLEMDKREKKRYLFYYSDIDRILFANRLEALTLVTDAEKDKPKVSNERFYEED